MTIKKRRRQWSDEEKIAIVDQTKLEGISIAHVARRYALNANYIHQWIRNPRYNPYPIAPQREVFLPVEVGPSFNSDPCGRLDQCGTGLKVSITTPDGVRIDLESVDDIDLLCRLVRGLQ